MTIYKQTHKHTSTKKHYWQERIPRDVGQDTAGDTIVGSPGRSRSGSVVRSTQVAAVARLQSLAQELPRAAGTAQNKNKYHV